MGKICKVEARVKLALRAKCEKLGECLLNVEYEVDKDILNDFGRFKVFIV